MNVNEPEADVHAYATPPPGSGVREHQQLNLTGMERQFLIAARARAEWNVTHAARMPGLSRDTLPYRMENYNIRIR